MAFNKITRVSGKPTVIEVNGEEIDFKTDQARSKAWEEYRMKGYKTPDNRDMRNYWG
tara:strand:- start:409 stop:579 length:171 start_codon:yes stop_codon:yes gene_type:complete